MFEVEVVADNSGKFCGVALKFETIENAIDYALDLSSRWPAVQQYRVIDENGCIVALEKI
jgi:hypothetical protein